MSCFSFSSGHQAVMYKCFIVVFWSRELPRCTQNVMSIHEGRLELSSNFYCVNLNLRKMTDTDSIDTELEHLRFSFRNVKTSWSSCPSKVAQVWSRGAIKISCGAFSIRKLESYTECSSHEKKVTPWAKKDKRQTKVVSEVRGRQKCQRGNWV